jgi:hypothetical protein
MHQGACTVHDVDLHTSLNAFRNLPTGVTVWQLLNSRDLRSFRLVAANPAAERELRAPLGFAVGKSIADSFPKLLDTPVPERYRRVILSGKPDTVGEFEYCDARIPKGVFWIDCFPLPERCVGAAVENITERKRNTEAQGRALRLLHCITVFLNEAPTALEATQFCVDEICKQIGWPVGRFFLSDEGSLTRFLPNPVWHFSDVRRFEAFRRATELYERDLTNKLALEHRVTQGRKAGLRKSVGFSVVEGGFLRGVLELSAESVAPLDEHTFRAISNVGFQLGQVFARERFGHECRRTQELMVDSHYDVMGEVRVAGETSLCAARAVRECRRDIRQTRGALSKEVLDAARQLRTTLEESKRLLAKPAAPPAAVESLVMAPRTSRVNATLSSLLANCSCVSCAAKIPQARYW